MQVSIPVYIEEFKPADGREPTYHVRPLLFDGPHAQARLLNRALAKLSGELRRRFDQLGRAHRHDRLAAELWNPGLETRRLKLKLNLRRRTAELTVLVAGLSALERMIAFSPSLPEIWFDVEDGETLEARAAEVYTAHFRELERDDDESWDARPENHSLDGKAYVGAVELEICPTQVFEKRDARPLAILGGFEKMSGAEELYKTGRNLDVLYPDELLRSVLRDRELEELARLMRSPDKRPVLLVGPPRVGKTALVHEMVFRRAETRGRPYGGEENTWLLSPQRLVSGMMFVGQWENRLLAILKEARKRRHVLYFDDLVGLFAAGVSRDADLSMAEVLKPYIERREVRFLAETTPEGLRVLRERDRGFADLFHLLPVEEPDEPRTLRMLLSAMRELEGRHRCRFGLDALPTVLDLMRRYGRGTAFPGKAADFLSRLAVKFVNAEVGRAEVLADFAAASGLSAGFLDGRVKLARADVEKALSAEVIGQPASVAACADAVVVAKARLNDPDRPLGSFLFLGPTGVGKTQCAKALAGYLFGDADRLIRLDMNEFVSPGSAARLTGTFADPEGLLTAAVRRQPFGVVLLDEIEKAHPDVFDLLLAVLGEGRLTDALGRTADFGNTLIVMTSNLGVRQAAAGGGFKPAARSDEQVYRSAAEEFFRPEFFNRIDRIVPFHRLGRGDIEAIARKLIAGLFARDGLVQRQCVLRIDPAAMDRIVRQGYHPDLGARALKRTIERQMTAPVAGRLAALPPGTPTVISLYPAGRDGIAVQTQGLVLAKAGPPPAAAVDLSDPDAALDRLYDVLQRVDDQIADLLPDGSVSHSDLRPEHHRYFAVREQAGRLRRMLAALEGRAARPTAIPGPAPRHGPRPVRPVKDRVLRWWGVRSHGWMFQEAAAATDLREYLAERSADAEAYGGSAADRLTDAVHEASLLAAMAGSDPDGDRVILHLRTVAENRPAPPKTAVAPRPGPSKPVKPAKPGKPAAKAPAKPKPAEPPAEPTGPVEKMAALYRELITGQWGYSATDLSIEGEPLLLIEGPGAAAVFAAEAGTHLWFPAYGPVFPVQVRVVVPEAGAEATRAVADQLAARRAWLADVAAGRADPDADPMSLGECVRLYDEGRYTADLRSGLLSSSVPPTPEELRTFVLARLAVPDELGGEPAD